MIILKEIQWDNFFSYAEDNHLVLDAVSVTQIIGKNGSGKSSIPLILEELLFSKNSKGIKKADIPNRYTDNKNLLGSLVFDVDEDSYVLTLSRKSSLKLTLEKNGEDISSHTSTNTLKTVESILGMDFKTFSQLIYQSSKSSLEFLTATDTARKKFLVGLFGLDSYIGIHEKFKKVLNEVNTKTKNLDGSLKTLHSLIEDIQKESFSEMELVPVEKLVSSNTTELHNLQENLQNIDKINSKVNKNNQYIKIREGIDISALIPRVKDKVILSSKKEEITTLTERGRALKNEVDKINSLGNSCHTCNQDISDEFKSSLLGNKVEDMNSLRAKVVDLQKEVSEGTKHNIEQTKIAKDIAEFGSVSNYIDDTLDTNVLDVNSLKKQISSIKDNIGVAKLRIDAAEAANSKANIHNSKISVRKQQLEDYTIRINKEAEELKELQDLTSKLSVIKNVFGTNGLVSYKIEYLIKDLESQINDYLLELSSGRFQLSFVISNDKLNIEISDNGNIISVEALSSGEMSRVNTATLLAIRKLMSQLSTTRINVLFLDEILGVLDEEGKEKLIDILLKEDLNTFLVSHEFSHPLIDKVCVTKTNNISELGEC